MNKADLLETAIDLGERCGVRTWLELKKILLLSLPSTERSRFSTRHPETKKQSLNELERKILDNYEKKTGIKLEVPR